ncbi:MAG: hypothetical protein ACFCBV_06650 [Phycisphaerales bacterium]
MKRLLALPATVWYVLTLQCEEADRIRANFSDPATTRAQKVGEQLHSALCGSCRAARKTMREISDAVGDLEQHSPAQPMPDGVRERMAQRLREHSGHD